jgi:hypothetical protein
VLAVGHNERVNMQIDTIAKYGNWIFRAAVIAGLCANIWLTSTFVTRTEFKETIREMNTKSDTDNKANVADHLRIQISIADIATTLKIMAATQARVDDHEMRLRYVEKTQTEVVSRLTGVERTVDRVKNP